MIYFALIILLLKTSGITYELFCIKEDSFAKVIGQVLGKIALITAFAYCITVLVEKIKWTI